MQRQYFISLLISNHDEFTSIPEFLGLRFLQAMVPHHEAAVVMAKDLVKKTKRPELQKLAKDIMSSPEAGGSDGSFASSDRRGNRTRAVLTAYTLSVMRVTDISLNRVC